MGSHWKEGKLRLLCVWVVEFLKAFGGGGFTLLRHNVPCASRWFASTSISQAADYAANLKCMGSDSPKRFDPRPSEHQYFKLPGSLLDE